MPRNAPPAQSCAATAVDTPATSTATAADAANDPALHKVSVLQSLQSDFSQEMSEAGHGLKAIVTLADDVSASKYCPNCRAVMIAGATECNRCGYSPSRPEGVNALRDKLITSLLAGGIVAIVLAVGFAWLSYFVGMLYKLELGFLGIPLALATVKAMSGKKIEWTIWHTVGAWTYIVGAYLIFRTAESAWLRINFFSLLDLLYFPLLGWVSYKLISKASRKRLIL